MPFRRPVFPAGVLSLATGTMLSAQPQALSVWDAAPLSSDPAQLRMAVAAVPVQEDAAVQGLLEDHQILIDDKGLKTIRYWYAFRVDQESAVEGWRDIGVSWSPWREERPEMRARVITPDGQVHELDPKTVGDYSTQSGDKEVYGDGRSLRAPLPQLSKGAIAEVLITRRETAPFSTAGASGWIPLVQRVPVQRTRIVVEAPAASDLRGKVYKLPGVATVRSAKDGRVRLTLDLGPAAAYKEPEDHVPDEDTRPAMLAYTTMSSWQSAAAAYADIVDRQISGADLGSWVAAATQGASTRDEKIAGILTKLHAQVKYTGLEFGERAIVPATPAETLRRGYGDCKDKASLLVAALRQAGIPADVALLLTGPGADSDPDIPGMGQFDHAIVHVPGTDPKWIDATAEYSRLGSRYPAVEGRMALVANRGTTGLEQIPAMQAEDNWELETREVTFGGEGPGKILETTEARGYFEANLRQDYAHSSDKNIRDTLLDYAKDAFKAGSLGKVSYTTPSDLASPFKLVLEARDVTSVTEEESRASVPVNPWSMLSDLIKELGGLPSAKDHDRKPRTSALRLSMPYLREQRYLIHRPAGFRAATLPVTRKLAFGPATLGMAFEERPDGAVVATFRFDTGKRVWTAAEVEEGLKAIKAYGDEDIVPVRFDEAGEADLEAGKVKEAILAFRELAAAEPSKAGPLLHYAKALLAAGLGAEARTQARKAVELEPKSVAAHSGYAWILQHDLVGRRFGAGWDPKTAAMEYRKAIALDPKDYPARGNLAILLDYAPEGTRYGSGADMLDAVKEYQAIRKDLGNHTLDTNLLIDLGRLDRFEEATALAKDMPADATRNGWLVASLVAVEGVDKGLAESKKTLTDPTALKGACAQAAETLLRLRRYPDAARLLAEGSEASGDAAQARAELLAKARKVDTVEDDPKDPRSVVKQLLAAMLQGKGLKRMKELVSPGLFQGESEEETDRKMKRALAGMGSSNIPPAVVLDLLVSLSQFTAEGDDATGHEVRVRTMDGKSTTFFVAAMEGRYRVVGISESPESLGAQALWCLDQGQPDQARAWLDKARSIIKSPPADDPAAGLPFARLWTKGRSANADEIRLAATVLASESSDGPDLTARLLDLRPKDPHAKEALPTDLAILYAATRSQASATRAAAAQRVLEAAPDSPTAIQLRFNALYGEGKWADAIRFAQDELRKQPDLPRLEGGMYQTMARSGRRAESDLGLQSLIDKGQADATDYNNLAWSAVVRGKVTPQALELIRTSTQNGGSASSVHTLAAILADLGRVPEAKAALDREMALRGLDAPGPNEWYVLGRIAEQLDLPAVATDCYQRVKAGDPKDLEDDGSCPVLAAQRLSALQAPAASPR